MRSLSRFESLLRDTVSNDMFNNSITTNPHGGYRIIDDKVSIGYLVGPYESIVDGMFHEMGHMIETDDLERLLMYNFGLRITSGQEFNGRFYPEPLTWNATKLECRCILWQELLCKMYEIPFDIDDFILSLEYMADFNCVPIKGYKWHYTNNDDYGYFDNVGNKIQSDFHLRDQLRMQSIMDYIEQQRSTNRYSIKELRKRWLNNTSYIEKYLKKKTV